MMLVRSVLITFAVALIIFRGIRPDPVALFELSDFIIA